MVVSIEVNSSLVANAIRDHIARDIAELETEEAKAHQAVATIQDRLAMLRGIRQTFEEHGGDVQEVAQPGESSAGS